MELTAIRDLKEKIEDTKWELLMLNSRMETIQAELIGVPLSKATAQLVENLATRITDTQNKHAKLIEELSRESEELAKQISQRVKGNAARVLYRRYILCETFKEIASAMSYSEHNIYYLHRRGVRSFSAKQGN